MKTSRNRQHEIKLSTSKNKILKLGIRIQLNKHWSSGLFTQARSSTSWARTKPAAGPGGFTAPVWLSHSLYQGSRVKKNGTQDTLMRAKMWHKLATSDHPQSPHSPVGVLFITRGDSPAANKEKGLRPTRSRPQSHGNWALAWMQHACVCLCPLNILDVELLFAIWEADSHPRKPNFLVLLTLTSHFKYHLCLGTTILWSTATRRASNY